MLYGKHNFDLSYLPFYAMKIFLGSHCSKVILCDLFYKKKIMCESKFSLCVLYGDAENRTFTKLGGCLWKQLKFCNDGVVPDNVAT